jgi:hypothetical protein
MAEYIFDGEIHAICDQYAYAIKKVYVKSDDQPSQIIKIHSDLCRKYCEYIYCFAKEEVIEYLINGLMSPFSGNFFLNENIRFVYKHPWYINVLVDYGTCGIKFKRLKNDNLSLDK